eukprot:g2219.t1
MAERNNSLASLQEQAEKKGAASRGKRAESRAKRDEAAEARGQAAAKQAEIDAAESEMKELDAKRDKLKEAYIRMMVSALGEDEATVKATAEACLEAPDVDKLKPAERKFVEVHQQARTAEKQKETLEWERSKIVEAAEALEAGAAGLEGDAVALATEIRELNGKIARLKVAHEHAEREQADKERIRAGVRGVIGEWYAPASPAPAPPPPGAAAGAAGGGDSSSSSSNDHSQVLLEKLVADAAAMEAALRAILPQQQRQREEREAGLAYDDDANDDDDGCGGVEESKGGAAGGHCGAAVAAGGGAAVAAGGGAAAGGAAAGGPPPHPGPVEGKAQLSEAERKRDLAERKRDAADAKAAEATAASARAKALIDGAASPLEEQRRLVQQLEAEVEQGKQHYIRTVLVDGIGMELGEATALADAAFDKAGAGSTGSTGSAAAGAGAAGAAGAGGGSSSSSAAADLSGLRPAEKAYVEPYLAAQAARAKMQELETQAGAMEARATGLREQAAGQRREAADLEAEAARLEQQDALVAAERAFRSKAAGEAAAVLGPWYRSASSGGGGGAAAGTDTALLLETLAGAVGRLQGMVQSTVLELRFQRAQGWRGGQLPQWAMAVPAADLEKARGIVIATSDTDKGGKALYDAAEAGKEGEAKALIVAGANVQWTDSELRDATALYIAARECTADPGSAETAIALALIEAGSNVNYADTEIGATPLYQAAFDGNLKMVSVLLEAGATVDLATKDGMTPLFIAAQEGHDKVVSVLIEEGKATVDLADNIGWTPLMMSCHMGERDTAAALLKGGASQAPTSTSAYDGNPAGSTAREIAERKDEYEWCDKWGDAFWRGDFEEAAREKEQHDLEQVRALVAASSGGDDKAGKALYGAALNGKEIAAKALTAAGANVNWLHTGGDDELDDNELDDDELDDDELGATPLYIAASKGHDKVVSMLLEVGAKVDLATTDYNQTPLYIAAFRGYDKVVSVLIEEGKATVDLAAKDGVTPLFIAAENGHDKVVSVLIKDGKATVDLAMTDEWGYTPLMAAARDGRKDVVALLLKHGADRTAQAKEGPKTARDIAEATWDGKPEKYEWGDVFWQTYL